jgi:hypothetical protein
VHGALSVPSIDVRAASPSPEGVLDRFLTTSARRVPVPYRAVRRLEASSTKLNATAWVEALTEFNPQTGLHVQILAEGGAGRIRSALRGVLDGEREATLPGRYRHAALTGENYSFQPGPVDADGLVALRAMPRRRDAALVDGTIFVTAEGDLVRVEDGWRRALRSGRVPSTWFGTTRAVADGSYPWRSSRSPTSNSPAPRSSS